MPVLCLLYTDTHPPSLSSLGTREAQLPATIPDNDTHLVIRKIVLRARCHRPSHKLNSSLILLSGELPIHQHIPLADECTHTRIVFHPYLRRTCHRRRSQVLIKLAVRCRDMTVDSSFCASARFCSKPSPSQIPGAWLFQAPTS